MSCTVKLDAFGSERGMDAAGLIDAGGGKVDHQRAGLRMGADRLADGGNLLAAGQREEDHLG